MDSRSLYERSVCSASSRARAASALPAVLMHAWLCACCGFLCSYDHHLWDNRVVGRIEVRQARVRSEPYTEETAAGYGPCGGAAALFDETQALTAAGDANDTAAEAFHCYGEFSERTEDREPFGEAKQYTWTPDTGSELLRSLVFTPTLLNSEMSYGGCQ